MGVSLLIALIGNLKCSFDARLNGAIKVVRVLDACENVFQLVLQLEVEELGAEVGADSSTVAVEYSVVGDLRLVIKVHQLLHVGIPVFHMVSLPDVRDNTIIISLDAKLHRPDSESVSRLQIV